MRSAKHKFTQYPIDVPAALRGHLPNLALYSSEHRSLDTLQLTPDCTITQQRNQITIQRLQAAFVVCRSHKIQLAA